MVGTPQIRNAGTLAGNVCQRPWCWYFRNGFPCYKNGGKTCFSVTGENEFHAIFGGGPSYIVHPSDTAPALVALDAKFRIAGPAGERLVAASDFFALPRTDPSKENVLADNEILIEVHLPATSKSLRSSYHKEMDRESWTHAVVSVAVALEMDGATCKSTPVWCWAASRRFRGEFQKWKRCSPANASHRNWRPRPVKRLLMALNLWPRTSTRFH